MKIENAEGKRERSINVSVYGLIALWFLFALVMSAQGRFVSGSQKAPLAMGLIFALPIVFFIVVYELSHSFRAFCKSLDLRAVTAVHVWRILGVVFLVLYVQRRLPGGFALPAGIGDMIIGFTAVPLALGIMRGSPIAAKWFVAWNVFGLLDLILAIVLGVLHSRSAIGVLAGHGPGPDTSPMSELPLSLVPTFFVPLFILLHLLALARRSEVTTHSAFQHRVAAKTPSR